MTNVKEQLDSSKWVSLCIIFQLRLHAFSVDQTKATPKHIELKTGHLNTSSVYSLQSQSRNHTEDVYGRMIIIELGSIVFSRCKIIINWSNLSQFVLYSICMRKDLLELFFKWIALVSWVIKWLFKWYNSFSD